MLLQNAHKVFDLYLNSPTTPLFKNGVAILVVITPAHVQIKSPALASDNAVRNAQHIRLVGVDIFLEQRKVFGFWFKRDDTRTPTGRETTKGSYIGSEIEPNGTRGQEESKLFVFINISLYNFINYFGIRGFWAGPKL
jgi:hypothetical protein